MRLRIGIGFIRTNGPVVAGGTVDRNPPFHWEAAVMMFVRMWCCWIALVHLLLAIAVDHLAADEPKSERKSPEVSAQPTSPEQAASNMTVPAGFRVTVFASEPVIRQPIAMTTDSRGRLWVAENNTYSDRKLNFDMSQRDRIVILEDVDHDNRADRRTVFWDQAKKLTSVEPGFGGVWALCPPQLLFIPDRNGDDIPDGKPEVVLDGWNDGEVRHNIANGLRWGPDGWLYGRHGIQATSLVGVPGSPPSQRTPINCGIWRYHPTRKQFEVVCRGTTNPWGMDWNEHGELFFINTVIGHLWHAIPGAHFQRMYGEDDNPHVYALLGQTADHVHWDTAESWSAINKIGLSRTTDQAGGGHAHAGLLIYQGDNWPERFRRTLFTINLHGRRLNNDTLERRGADYVGHHAADFLKSSDPWFRCVDLISGSDGGVFLADWSDIGECHQNDAVHRESGRIYKIDYQNPGRPAVADVAAASDEQLVQLQLHRNDWYARQARRVLQERASAGKMMEKVHAPLRTIFETDHDPAHKLRALWCLHATSGDPTPWLLAQLRHENEHVRTWAVRLLGDDKTPSKQVVNDLCAMVRGESSGLVLLYLASALQQLVLADRWQLAAGLTEHSEFAADPVLPLMVWYGIEPAVPEYPEQALRLAANGRMPTVTRMIARRLSENLGSMPDPVDRLVSLAAEPGSPARSRAILTGMAEALRGWRKAPMPKSWKSNQAVLASSRDEDVQQMVREIAVVFGDGRALRDLLQIVGKKNSDLAARRDAVRVLVEARDINVVPLLRDLVFDRDLGSDAIRGLAAFDDVEIPVFLLKSYHKLRDTGRAAAIVALGSRPASARLLLTAVASGAIDRSLVPTFQIRQMSTFPDEKFRRQVSHIWPELKMISGAKRQRIDQLKSLFGAIAVTPADRVNGRRRFVQSCSTCHMLFGQGGKIGPDLTGAQRMNLDYLLENIVDPSATVSPGYRMSTIVLVDGRVLNAIVGDTMGSTLTVQTPTERLVISRSDIEQIRKSEQSLMPDGLLDTLPNKEIADLIAYLMSSEQIPLTVETGGANRSGPIDKSH